MCNIFTALSNLEFNHEENIFFHYYLLSKSSLYKARKELGRSKSSINPVKNSCILKIAMAFDLEIRKGDKLNAEEELEFANYVF